MMTSCFGHKHAMWLILFTRHFRITRLLLSLWLILFTLIKNSTNLKINSRKELYNLKDNLYRYKCKTLYWFANVTKLKAFAGDQRIGSLRNLTCLVMVWTILPFVCASISDESFYRLCLCYLFNYLILMM